MPRKSYPNDISSFREIHETRNGGIEGRTLWALSRALTLKVASWTSHTPFEDERNALIIHNDYEVQLWGQRLNLTRIMGATRSDCCDGGTAVIFGRLG